MQNLEESCEKRILRSDLKSCISLPNSLRDNDSVKVTFILLNGKLIIKTAFYH